MRNFARLSGVLRIEMAMAGCNMMRSIQFLAICLIYAAVISTAFSQDDPAVTPEQIKQAEEVMKKTQDMGPW